MKQLTEDEIIRQVHQPPSDGSTTCTGIIDVDECSIALPVSNPVLPHHLQPLDASQGQEVLHASGCYEVLTLGQLDVLAINVDE